MTARTRGRDETKSAEPRPLLRGVAKPIAPTMRTRLRTLLQRLVVWQRTFDRWPKAGERSPDATAFVSVYSNGQLRGCFGVDDGTTKERVARAFLRAANDARFGGLGGDSDADVVAILSYAHSIAPLDAADAVRTIEVGRHGLLYVRDDGGAAILLPQVARDGGLGPSGLLEALKRKADAKVLESGRLFTFETHDVSSRESALGRRRNPLASGAAFLARMVGRDGHIDFAMNARTGARERIGQMHHGRAAIVVKALEDCGEKAIAARARRRLARDIDSALSGRALDGWPDDPCVRAGSVALAVLAGVEAEKELARLAKKTSFEGSAWHAAQVVVALGGDAPQRMYDACIIDLDARPWAPWTALAAHAREDAAVKSRCATELGRSVRDSSPHRGGVGFREVPEVALTAIVVEALATCTDARSREACARARTFLLEHQNHAGRAHGPVDPQLAEGGFPLTPVNDMLRADVTAHALLALRASRFGR